jgi:starch phosphorylase
MVGDYNKRSYLPASRSYQALKADNQARAKAAFEWRTRVRSAWPSVSICEVADTASAVNALGESFTIRVTVDLGPLTPGDVAVQALMGSVGSNRDLQEVEIHNLELVSGEQGRYEFSGSFACDRSGHLGYTVRIVPRHADVNVVHELPIVCWESAN